MQNKYFYIWLACIIAVLFALPGCSSSKKLKTTTITHVDSAVHHTEVKAATTDHTQQHVIKHIAKAHNNITVEFDTTKHAVNVGDTTGTWTIGTAIDYLKEGKPHSTKINGNVITSDQPITRITLNTGNGSTDITKFIESQNSSTKDSTNDSTKLVKDSKAEVKVKTSTGLGVAFYIWLTVALAGVYLLYHFGGLDWFFAWLKRKRDSSST